MALFKRKGVWYARIVRQGRDIRLSTGTPNKRLAERIEAKIKADIAEGKFLEVKRRPNQGPTLGEFAKEYDKYGQTNLRSWRDERSRMKRIVASFGQRPIRSIGPKDLEEFKSDLSKDHRPAGVNRYIARLKSVFRIAKSWGYVDSNPAAEVKALPERNQRLRFLTREEFDRLLAAAREDLRPLLTLAAFTGMRAGELLRLAWTEVDWENTIIRVAHSKNNERREIPMCEQVWNSLMGIRTQRLRSPQVLQWADGSPIRNFRKPFNQALKDATIEDFRFHDLRHTFASWMVMAGADLRTVQELLGHKSLAMVMRYSHLSQRHLREAIKRLDRRPEGEVKEAKS